MQLRFQTSEAGVVNTVPPLSDRLIKQLDELSPTKSSKRMMLGGAMEIRVPGSASRIQHVYCV